MTLYHTQCSIMLQGSPKKAESGLTISEQFAIDINLIGNVIKNTQNLQQINNALRDSIEKWKSKLEDDNTEKQNDDKKKERLKNKSKPKKSLQAYEKSPCAKCKKSCLTKFQKCVMCENVQHINCSGIEQAQKQLYYEGKKPIACVECITDSSKIDQLLKRAIEFKPSEEEQNDLELLEETVTPQADVPTPTTTTPTTDTNVESENKSVES